MRLRSIGSGVFVATVVSQFFATAGLGDEKSAEPEAPKSASAVKAGARYREALEKVEEELARRQKEVRDAYARELDESRKEALGNDDIDEAQRIVAAKRALDGVKSTAEPADSADDAKPGRGAFSVLLARLGTGKDWADVTKQVRKRVRSSRLKMTNPLLGDALRALGFPDPAPNRRKLLVVVYSVDGKVGMVVAEPDEEVDLPPKKK